MCESTAFLKQGNEEKRLMDNVIYVIPQNGEVYLENILGEQLTVKGEVESIRLLDHKLYIRA